MQNAGQQYGQGGASSHQSAPFGGHTEPTANSGSITSSLRQFRRKNEDKQPLSENTNTVSESHVARVAPHNVYPPRPAECYRYPTQYQDYGLSSPVKFSDISDSLQPIQDHISPSVIQKAKSKDYMEICNVQQPHMKQSFPDHHLNGQQAYHDSNVHPHAQYIHKEPQGHPTYNKPESQYFSKDQQYSPQHPQQIPKYNMAPQIRKYPLTENDFLSKLRRIHPNMARSIMSDHHLQESQSPYPTMDQNRMFSPQNQRFMNYPSSVQNNHYPHSYMPSQPYPNYPASCSYTRAPQMGPRFPPVNPHERSISPRRGYVENMSMPPMNYGTMPQKMSPNYPQYNAPEYAQHYQHRRASISQDYYQQHFKPAQYLPHQMSAQEMASENRMAVSDINIKQYIENWADEETATEITQLENTRLCKENVRIRDDQSSTETVYMINASELQYLENGIPLVTSENGIPVVTSENGQYIIKSGVSLDNATGMVRILDKNTQMAVEENNGERVVNLHIVDPMNSTKTDCMLSTKPNDLNQRINNENVYGMDEKPRVVVHQNTVIQSSYQSSSVARDLAPLEDAVKVGNSLPIITDNDASPELRLLDEELHRSIIKESKRETVDKNCSPINMEELEEFREEMLQTSVICPIKSLDDHLVGEIDQSLSKIDSAQPVKEPEELTDQKSDILEKNENKDISIEEKVVTKTDDNDKANEQAKDPEITETEDAVNTITEQYTSEQVNKDIGLKDLVEGVESNEESSLTKREKSEEILEDESGLSADQISSANIEDINKMDKDVIDDLTADCQKSKEPTLNQMKVGSIDKEIYPAPHEVKPGEPEINDATSEKKPLTVTQFDLSCDIGAESKRTFKRTRRFFSVDDIINNIGNKLKAGKDERRHSLQLTKEFLQKEIAHTFFSKELVYRKISEHDEDKREKPGSEQEEQQVEVEVKDEPKNKTVGEPKVKTVNEPIDAPINEPKDEMVIIGELKDIEKVNEECGEKIEVGDIKTELKEETSQTAEENDAATLVAQVKDENEAPDYDKGQLSSKEIKVTLKIEEIESDLAKGNAEMEADPEIKEIPVTESKHPKVNEPEKEPVELVKLHEATKESQTIIEVECGSTGAEKEIQIISDRDTITNESEENEMKVDEVKMGEKIEKKLENAPSGMSDVLISAREGKELTEQQEKLADISIEEIIAETMSENLGMVANENDDITVKNKEGKTMDSLQQSTKERVIKDLEDDETPAENVKDPLQVDSCNIKENLTEMVESSKLSIDFPQIIVDKEYSSSQPDEVFSEEIVTDTKELLTDSRSDPLEVPDQVLYRNVIRVEESSVLLHIAGELVEINVNTVNGKKVITVFPLSDSTIVDFNDNYETCASGDATDPLKLDGNMNDSFDNFAEVVGYHEVVAQSEPVEPTSEIIIGMDLSLEAEIKLDVEQPQVAFTTKAAKKAYDTDLQIPSITTSDDFFENNNPDTYTANDKVSSSKEPVKSRKSGKIDSRKKHNAKKSVPKPTNKKSLRELLNARQIKKAKILEMAVKKKDDEEDFVPFRELIKARKLKKLKLQENKNNEDGKVDSTNKIDEISKEGSSVIIEKDTRIESPLKKESAIRKKTSSSENIKKSHVSENRGVKNKERDSKTQRKPTLSDEKNKSKAEKVTETKTMNDKIKIEKEAKDKPKENSILSADLDNPKEKPAKKVTFGDASHKGQPKGNCKELVVDKVIEKNRQKFEDPRLKHRNNGSTVARRITATYEGLEVKKRLSLEEYNRRKRKLLAVDKVEDESVSKKQATEDDSISNESKSKTSDETPTFKSKTGLEIPEKIKFPRPKSLDDLNLGKPKENNVSKRKLSLEAKPNYYDWEETQSPKCNNNNNNLDHQFSEFRGVINDKNANRSKSIININELRVKSFTENSEDEILQNYKEQCESKLSSLNLQIPRSKPLLNGERQIMNPFSKPETANLMQRFLKNEKLSHAEMEKVRKIISYKRLMQQLKKIKSPDLPDSPLSPKYEIRKEIGAMKLHLKKMSNVDYKKRKNRFRHLGSEPVTASDSDLSEKQNGADYSVIQSKCLAGVVPKLIIKKKN